MSPCSSSWKQKGNQTSQIPTLPLEECLAKTRRVGEGTEKGCTVESHLVATYLVGRVLLEYYRNFRSGELFVEHDLIAPLVHDIGKISPTFQDKIYDAIEEPKNMTSYNVKSYENHCVTSSVVLFQGFHLENLARVAASHHGKYCNSGNNTVETEWLGQKPWETLRETLVRQLCDRFSLALEDISSEEWKRKLVLGLTILSDWLSSGMDLAHGEVPTEEMCEEAVRQAGFLPFQCRKRLAFGDVFRSADKTGWEPNYLQRKMAENVQPGAVYVLEMEMGSGKTEAALYLAYKLLAEHRHNGLYFALPTCLTSDKIYDRVTPFLKSILSPESPEWKTMLLHGKAWLRKYLSKTSETGFQEGDPEKDDWFDSRKRGLLAPFAVGTIDQLLMSVIHVRHSALRALGAAGKVVVLDEVHSYDAYTGALIQRLVEFLRKWGCTVIILSATLTQKTREALLGMPSDPNFCDVYPLLSIREGDKVTSYILSVPETEKVVKIRHGSSEEESLLRVVERANRGECVLWIENTVADAQRVYKQLAAMQLPHVELGLIHSQFQEHARRMNEKKWVDRYGKDASPAERAGGKILVGTQVLEQSVDIDADYLVTRLCPVDMLLQRIGRLWRHRTLDTFRPVGAECCAEILNEMPFENLSTYSGYEKTPPVYAAYVLARTQEVLEPLCEISIPRDMRTLIEATYEEREETDYYAHLKAKLHEEIAELERFAHLSSGEAHSEGPDTEASTRYSEKEKVDVLLLEDYNPTQRLIKPYGSPKWIRLPEKNADKKRLNKCGAVLSGFLVRVYLKIAPSYAGFPLDFLSHVLYVGHGQDSEKDRPLRAAFVGPDGELQNFFRLPAVSEDDEYSMNYHETFGYSYEKKGKSL